MSGSLPGTVTFDNGTALNDYFQGFMFGTTLSFSVDLEGPAVNSPDGTSTSGSTFAFSMFSDSAGTVPVLTTDTVNGFAGTLELNLDGTASPSNPSPQTVISNVSPVPEPSSFALLLAVMLGTVYLHRRHAVERTR